MYVAIFEELFSPSARHSAEERRRLTLVRDEQGRSTPHKGSVDLDSGRVVIRRDFRRKPPGHRQVTRAVVDLPDEPPPAA